MMEEAPSWAQSASEGSKPLTTPPISPSRQARRAAERLEVKLQKLQDVSTVDTGNTKDHIETPITLWKSQSQTNQNTKLSLSALIDCGATANFIDEQFALLLKLTPLETKAAKVVDVNGRTISPTKQALFRIPMSISDAPPTTYTFRAIPMQGHRVILGLPWLREVNPLIDWVTGSIKVPKNIRVLKQTDFDDELDDSPIYAYYTTQKTPSALPTVYSSYADVFSEQASTTLPPHRGNLDHAIDLLPGTTPPFGPLYNLSESELGVLKDYIKQNLKSGFIRRSKSSAGSPILFVKKKDGGLQLCVDYRGLNAITVRDQYPIPLISEILDQLRRAKRFTKINLRGAYNLIRVKQGDK